MNALTAALKEELNVEMISLGGLQVPESVVVSLWYWLVALGRGKAPRCCILPVLRPRRAFRFACSR